MNQQPPPIPDDSAPRPEGDLPFGSALPSEPAEPPPLQAEAPFGAAFDPQFASPPPAPGWVPPTVPGRIQVQEAGASPVMVLVMGIGSLVLTASGCCCSITPLIGFPLGVLAWLVALPLGIVAWFWGTAELRKIEKGLLPRTVKSQLEAGRICGLIGIIFVLLVGGYVIIRIVISVIALASAGGP